MKPNPFIDIIATIMVMLTLGTLGYWYMVENCNTYKTEGKYVCRKNN